MARTSPARASLLLFFLFLIGLSVTAFAFVDLRWTHLVLVRASEQPRKRSAVDPKQLQRLRASILNVRAQCAGGEYTGTGFVVKPGFVATAAHVLGDRQVCDGPIRLVDHKGLEHV